MSSLLRVCMLSATIVLASPSLIAQTASAGTAASAASPGKAMSPDCKSRHDHGAEKGTPTPKSALCAEAPASGAKGKSKAPKARVHDHGKFHKNQG